MTIVGETQLRRLLSGMRPVLAPEIFVFVTLPDGRCPEELDPLMSFREAEGLTLILRASEAAERGLAGTFHCRLITLEVHSSLDAVGFLAAITARLAARGIGVNPVAAFHHDHLFVPAHRAEEALEALLALAAESAARA